VQSVSVVAETIRSTNDNAEVTLKLVTDNPSVYRISYNLHVNWISPNENSHFISHPHLGRLFHIGWIPVG